MIYHYGQLLIVGGVARDLMLTADENIIILDVSMSGVDREKLLWNKVHFNGIFPQPLLIGSSVSCSDDTMVIMGGGAVCFSFGTFWNRGCFTLSLQMMPRNEHSERNEYGSLALKTWRYLQTVESCASGKSADNGGGPSTLNGKNAFDLVTIPKRKISSAYDFSTLVSLAKPVILEELDLGSCTTAWTSSYLQDHIGRDKKVCLDQRATHKNVADGTGCHSSGIS